MKMCIHIIQICRLLILGRGLLYWGMHKSGSRAFFCEDIRREGAKVDAGEALSGIEALGNAGGGTSNNIPWSRRTLILPFQWPYTQAWSITV